MEIRARVVAVQVDLVCSSCGQGVMRYEKTIFENPVRYRHQCNKCSRIENLTGRCYPAIDYEKEGNHAQ